MKKKIEVFFSAPFQTKNAKLDPKKNLGALLWCLKNNDIAKIQELIADPQFDPKLFLHYLPPKFKPNVKIVISASSNSKNTKVPKVKAESDLPIIFACNSKEMLKVILGENYERGFLAFDRSIEDQNKVTRSLSETLARINLDLFEQLFVSDEYGRNLILNSAQFNDQSSILDRFIKVLEYINLLTIQEPGNQYDAERMELKEAIRYLTCNFKDLLYKPNKSNQTCLSHVIWHIKENLGKLIHKKDLPRYCEAATDLIAQAPQLLYTDKMCQDVDKIALVNIIISEYKVFGANIIRTLFSDDLISKCFEEDCILLARFLYGKFALNRDLTNCAHDFTYKIFKKYVENNKKDEAIKIAKAIPRLLTEPFEASGPRGAAIAESRLDFLGFVMRRGEKFQHLLNGFCEILKENSETKEEYFAIIATSISLATKGKLDKDKFPEICQDLYEVFKNDLEAKNLESLKILLKLFPSMIHENYGSYKTHPDKPPRDITFLGYAMAISATDPEIYQEFDKAAKSIKPSQEELQLEKEMRKLEKRLDTPRATASSCAADTLKSPAEKTSSH